MTRMRLKAIILKSKCKCTTFSEEEKAYMDKTLKHGFESITKDKDDEGHRDTKGLKLGNKT